jgi:thiol-disulfide isomerase/thioredoxin
MKLSRVFSPVLGAAFLLGFTACGPKKDKEAPAPKVSAAPEAAKSIAALPTLGPAPSWQLKDLNGNVVSSEQFKGKVVVVDFWATWCGPCRQEIPGYVELAKKYEKQGLVIVGVSLDQAGPEVVKAFGQRYGVSYPLVMGDDEVQAKFGGMEAIPTTFLIDRTGNVRDKKVGVEPTEDYEKKIASLL